MNVLLTAAGRRGYLVRWFKQALAGAGRVIVTNTEPDAPAMLAADEAIVVPPSHHPDYPGIIGRLCQRLGVGLHCSLHDLDVLALAPHRDALRRLGVASTLPDADWARLCLDKLACGVRLREAGFQVPWSSVSLADTRAALARDEVGFPLVVKSRLGFGSSGLRRCHTLEELDWYHREAVALQERSLARRFLPLPPGESVLIQPAVTGVECCMDLVHDLEGRYAAHFVCEVHAMRAGESDSATTRASAPLDGLAHALSALTRHPGIWGVDVFLGGNAGEPGVGHGGASLIDINPRFTGDYVFQHLAGADVPAALLAWARGEPAERAWLSPAVGVRGLKELVPVRVPETVTASGRLKPLAER